MDFLKLGYSFGNLNIGRIWSIAWRWMLVIAFMFAVSYSIQTAFGFIWWLLLGKSGAVAVLYKTIVFAFFTVLLVFFVIVSIYKKGERWVSEVASSHDSDGKRCKVDVLGKPISSLPPLLSAWVDGGRFVWRPMSCGWDKDGTDHHGCHQYVLYEDPHKKAGVGLLLMEEWDERINLPSGCKLIGWCWDYELCSYLRYHSFVLSV